MASIRLVSTNLLGCLLSFSAVAAQDAPKSQESDVNSRVARSLDTLIKLDKYDFDYEVKGGISGLRNIFAFPGQGQAAKKPKNVIRVKKHGALICWTKNEGDKVIGNHGRRWVALGSDGDWIPSRKVVDPFWKNQFLADPAFLAERIKHLLKTTKWEHAPIETLDDRPVRAYKCTLEAKDAHRLVDCGSLPQGSPFGAVGQMVIVAGAGGAARMPKGELKIELTLIEHPATHIPLKIMASLYSKSANNVRVQIQGLGGGFGDDEEEEEEDPKKKKKKKPSSSIELRFVRSKESAIKELDDEARLLLNAPRKGL